MESRLKNDIMRAVQSAVKEADDLRGEVWLSAEQVAARFPCWSRSWLNRYGSSLPRTRAVVTCANEKRYASAWVYPERKLNRMLADGSAQMLKPNDHE